MRYQGTATIRTADGTEYDAEVNLRAHEGIEGGVMRRGWGGTAVVTNFNITQIGDATIRFPEGHEGSIFIADVQSNVIDIDGNGAPPF